MSRLAHSPGQPLHTKGPVDAHTVALFHPGPCPMISADPQRSRERRLHPKGCHLTHLMEAGVRSVLECLGEVTISAGHSLAGPVSRTSWYLRGWISPF